VVYNATNNAIIAIIISFLTTGEIFYMECCTWTPVLNGLDVIWRDVADGPL